jgi:hypothetical protein
MNFYYDLYRQGQIAEAKTYAIEAKTAADQSNDRMRELEFTVNRMALACQAMWELLRARSGITDDELLAKMHEVDLRDGIEDGRMTTKIIHCAKCGRPSNTRNARCMYCGAQLPRPSVFQ